MNEENTRKLLERFSFIPKANPLYPTDSGVSMFIDCGDGWFNLIWKLCEGIERILTMPENSRLKENFVVEQIKEKFAGLRFYVSLLDGGINTLIDRAEYDSYHICEICGEPGKPRDGGWYRTLCDKHAEERGQIKIWEVKWDAEHLKRIGVSEMSDSKCQEACDGYCLMFKGINCRYTTVDEYATLLKEREDRINEIKTKGSIMSWDMWNIHERIANEANEKCGELRKRKQQKQKLG